MIGLITTCSGFPVMHEVFEDKREFDKQVARAMTLIERKEPGRLAKFLKKSDQPGAPFVFDADLRTKTEKLLGIKGYVTNLPPNARGYQGSRISLLYGINGGEISRNQNRAVAQTGQRSTVEVTRGAPA
jgi:hypothetical protein